MGGIVASSPELMQAVSQAPRSMNQGGYIPGYDEGGHVHPHNTESHKERILRTLSIHIRMFTEKLKRL